MYSLKFILFLGLAMLLTLSQKGPSRAAEAGDGPKVLAFYYTWYGTPEFQGRWVHWGEGGKSPDNLDAGGFPDVGATHHPLRLYDSHDPETIREHLTLAAEAGIDALIGTWWRQDDYHDKALRKVIREAKKSPVQISVYYEIAPAVDKSDGTRLIEAVVDDFRYILDTYADSPAFFKSDGKPVIFIYGRALAQIGRDSWTEAVRRIKAYRPCILIGDSISPDWLEVFDGLHDYNPVGAVVAGTNMQDYYQRQVTACRAAEKIATVTVIPGYDDSNIGRKNVIIADREDGLLYKRLWAHAIRSKPDWVLITSFNEWHEGSEIEPSREHGRMYLDLTSRYASIFARGSAGRFVDESIARISGASSPEKLIHSLTPRPDGSWLLGNLDTSAGTISISARAFRQPLVFELGQDGRHIRRVYPAVRGRSLNLRVVPMSDYAIYECEDFVHSVLESVCEVSPRSMQMGQKFDVLASRLADLRSSRLDDEAAREMRLVSDAYQALLGVEFNLEMDYSASSPSADYAIFAGRDFAVTCALNNRRGERLDSAVMRLLAPDEWKVSPVLHKIPEGSLTSGISTSLDFRIQAPDRSTFRPKTFPLMAELTVVHRGSSVVFHQPYWVEITDPFRPSLKIVEATPDRITANISMKTEFPGKPMNDVSVYPFIPQNIRVEPARQTLSFGSRGTAKVSYIKAGPAGPNLRAVTLVMKVDEHIVRLRSVMEAVLPLGTRTAMPGLWMNEADDGLTQSASINGRSCRQTVKNRFSDTRYVYFATSENFPSDGNSYITVTYFDGPEGSFTLQYDSMDPKATMDGAYKDAPDVLRLEGTSEWKQKTFTLPDVRFANRQNAKSDFRLAAQGADLAVAYIAVSKFKPGSDQ